MSKNILALDASTEALSIALQYQGKHYTFFEVCPQQHSQKILPQIDALLKQANCTLQDLDALAFSQGPGSFTGVRISVSIAQGLAFSANLPVIGLSSLQIMAQQAIEQVIVKQKTEENTTIYSAIDARMGEVYFARYQVVSENGISIAELVGEQQVIKPDKLTIAPHAALAVGTGWQAHPQLLTKHAQLHEISSITLPNAEFMLPLAEKELHQGNTLEAKDAQPVYVRDTVTWKKLPHKA